MSLLKRRTTIVCSILIAVATCGLTPKSNADIIHESATMGPVDQYPGVGWIFDTQFLGSRFEITETTEITSIGGHIGSENDLLIFGAIVALDDNIDFPNGFPFWQSDIIAWNYFRPPALSADIRIPLSVTLQPGWYGLFFGAGEFGLSNNAEAFMPGGGQSSYPGSSYFHWNGVTETWYNTFYGSGYPRFVVEGHPYLPPVEIYGTKFNDVDGDGVWDAGEPNMPGWEIYLDENGNGTYEPSEPNVITDSGGMYRFTDLDTPVTYRVREVMKDGWTQTLPGGPGNEYVIDAEPNNIYGPCDFGNIEGAPTKYGGGDGTEGNPYQIRTASHMDQIGQNQEDWSSYFILMADIDMSAYQGTSYHIIGTTPFVDPVEDPFLGEFDGNGHSISNFTYQTSAFKLYVGLFGVINSGGVKNLKVINPNIDVPDASNVGAIVGYIGMGVKISDCDVVGGSVNGNLYVGGVAGQTYHGNISSCSNTAAVQGHDDVGGIVGYARAGSVVDSYATGTVTANLTGGGLVGNLFRYARITRCYSTGLVSGAPAGGLVGDSTGTSIRCFWDINTSNQSDSAEGIGLPTAGLKQIDTFAGWGCPHVWVLDVAIAYPRLERENTPGVPLPVPAYGSGSGEEESPYLIYTAEQFNDIGKYECHQASHFKLMADIVLDPDVDDNYYLIGPNYSFYGVFDGNHHKIIQPRYSQEDPDVRFIGIFSAINGLGDNNAVVKDLGIEDPVITSAGVVVGGLAGSLYKGTIENCYVKGGSITGADAVGGLAGTVEYHSSNLIRNSYSNTTVSGSAYVGGLTSYFTGGTIEFCYAAGSVSDSEYAGGLTGSGYYDPDSTTVTSSFYDTETTGQSGGQGVALSTEDMQTITTYAGWDFGNLWTICEGTHYPRFQWQVLPADFVCPEGVELADLMVLSEEWLAASPLPSVDIAPEGAPDGKENLLDYALFADYWQVGVD